METNSNYYLTTIKNAFDIKQQQNPQYSLRAFARDLEMDPSTLSKVMKGTRGLTIKDSRFVAQKLNLNPQERTLFLESLYRTKAQIDDIKIDPVDTRFMLDESYHTVIAEWEHFVVETFLELDGIDPTVEEVAKSLGISIDRALEVLINLKNCGLIVEDENGKLKKAHSKIRTPEDVTNKALRESHLETLELGKKKIDDVEVELRDFSSMTLAVDMEKIPEAKSIIREFRQKMMALLKNGNKTEVYQIAIQFYPVTERYKGNK